MNITFPATLETFVADQERMIHRKLSATEREATAAWLEIFNDVSVGNLDGATALEKIDYIINSATDPDILRFLRAAREWIIVAKEAQ